MFTFAALSLSFLAATVLGASPLIVHERLADTPAGFLRTGTPSASQVLTLRLNLASSNLAGLANALDAASDPTSPTFRQWLSKEDVESYARPTQETLDAVNEWLSSNGISVAGPLTAAQDWMQFEVPVDKAEAMLNAEFAVFTHSASGKTTVRSLAYSLPANLKSHINLVHPITSFTGPNRPTPLLSTPPTKRSSAAKPAKSDCDSLIVPTCLQSLYGIPTTPATGAAGGGIGVVGMDDQYANQADLKTFLTDYRTDMSSETTFTLVSVDNGKNVQTPSKAGTEANLDIQYTVGVATNVPVTFISIGEKTQDGASGGYLDVINAMLNETSPPAVLTTSYGFDVESDLSEALTIALCNSYMQLTSRGVSILFASGDGGVASTPGVQCTSSSFPPTFPTCPYVTLVGSTQNIPEVGADFTAGGFSNYFPTASFQASAVVTYLKVLGSEYAGAFNKTGRAYPDVSTQGGNVEIIQDTAKTSVGGTSCSSPIFSSVIGLLNDELLNAGKPVLGFLNPWLYANPSMFNDVTTGSNPGCGTNGFSATTGWDPVTGLGTPNYSAMRTAAGL